MVFWSFAFARLRVPVYTTVWCADLVGAISRLVSCALPVHLHKTIHFDLISETKGILCTYSLSVFAEQGLLGATHSLKKTAVFWVPHIPQRRQSYFGCHTFLKRRQSSFGCHTFLKRRQSFFTTFLPNKAILSQMANLEMSARVFSVFLVQI